MKKRILAIISVLLIFALAFTGCGAKEESASSGFVPEYYKEEAMPEEGITTGVDDVEVSENSGALNNRKLIERVNISVQTREYDNFVANIDKAVKEYGGYVEQSEIYNETNYNCDRGAYLTIRIPAENLNAFTSLVSDMGTVTNKSSSVEDITLQYVDTQSHIKALRTEEETLLRLLEEAKDLDDVLVLQARLTEIRYQLESYESQLRSYDNLVNYATVQLDIMEVDREVVNADAETVWDEIGANFSTAFYKIGRFFRNLFVFLISALPYIAVIGGIVFVIVYFCIVRPIRKRRKSEEAKKENKE